MGALQRRPPSGGSAGRGRLQGRAGAVRVSEGAAAAWALPRPCLALGAGLEGPGGRLHPPCCSPVPYLEVTNLTTPLLVAPRSFLSTMRPTSRNFATSRGRSDSAMTLCRPMGGPSALLTSRGRCAAMTGAQQAHLFTKRPPRSKKKGQEERRANNANSHVVRLGSHCAAPSLLRGHIKSQVSAVDSLSHTPTAQPMPSQ